MLHYAIITSLISIWFVGAVCALLGLCVLAHRLFCQAVEAWYGHQNVQEMIRLYRAHKREQAERAVDESRNRLRQHAGKDE